MSIEKLNLEQLLAQEQRNKMAMDIDSDASPLNNEVRGIIGAFVSTFQSMQLHALQSQLSAASAVALPSSLRPDPAGFSREPIVLSNDRAQLEERRQRVEARAVEARHERRVARQADGHQLAQAPGAPRVDLMTRMQF